MISTLQNLIIPKSKVIKLIEKSILKKSLCDFSRKNIQVYKLMII